MNNLEKFRKELESLDSHGKILLDDFQQNQEKATKFNSEYQTWYSESLEVIRQLLPNRVNEFAELYYGEKRKAITSSTYTIKDWLLGIRATEDIYGKKRYDDFAAAIMRFQSQVSILMSAYKRFESSIFDIKQMVEADLFDSELDVAEELCKHGFTRASGAIAGVIIEAHLQQVCENHTIKVTKANPTITELADLLKTTSIIGVPEWRKLYQLADLRNLCDHKKAQDPTKDQAEELIQGTSKLIKTLF